MPKTPTFRIEIEAVYTDSAGIEARLAALQSRIGTTNREVNELERRFRGLNDSLRLVKAATGGTTDGLKKAGDAAKSSAEEARQGSQEWQKLEDAISQARGEYKAFRREQITGADEGPTLNPATLSIGKIRDDIAVLDAQRASYETAIRNIGGGIDRNETAIRGMEGQGDLEKEIAQYGRLTVARRQAREATQELADAQQQLGRSYGSDNGQQRLDATERYRAALEKSRTATRELASAEAERERIVAEQDRVYNDYLDTQRRAASRRERTRAPRRRRSTPKTSGESSTSSRGRTVHCTSRGSSPSPPLASWRMPSGSSPRHRQRATRSPRPPQRSRSPTRSATRPTRPCARPRAGAAEPRRGGRPQADRRRAGCDQRQRRANRRRATHARLRAAPDGGARGRRSRRGRGARPRHDGAEPRGGRHPGAGAGMGTRWLPPSAARRRDHPARAAPAAGAGSHHRRAEVDRREQGSRRPRQADARVRHAVRRAATGEGCRTGSRGRPAGARPRARHRRARGAGEGVGACRRRTAPSHRCDRRREPRVPHARTRP